MPRATSTRPPTAVELAAALMLLVPSCLMTLAPVTTRAEDGLTAAEVEDVLDQGGVQFVRLPDHQLRAQLVAGDMHGHLTFSYTGTIENYWPFGIVGAHYAFVSVIGLDDRLAARGTADRMARRPRTTTASRGFVCANVIVQRIAASGLNPDRLDRFLLERFAAAATNDRPLRPGG